MSIEKSIGWVSKTINPIGGLCPREYRCSYCYVPPFYKRFGWKTEPHLKLEVFEQARRRRKPTRYFLCSTHDLFGPWIPKEWIKAVLSTVDTLRQHTFLLLTKYPMRIHKQWRVQLPRNLWLGTTITDQEAMLQCCPIGTSGATVRFISFEPLLGSVIIPDQFWADIDWIIIGALTLPGGRTRQPEPEWVDSLIWQADRHKIPVFMKDNLEWENRRREFPEQKAKEA